ncbi:MAG: IS5 family transposase, partial [Geodermatophilales bacterium]|nr:IS5 family transposase [Geodermatophilales bacterium]
MGSSPAYPSDLTDAQWALIEPLVPVLSSRGRGTRGGRPPKYPRRRIVDAILYVDRTGCSWRQLPHDFPPWDTVYFYFQRWAADGTTDRIHDALRDAVRDAAGRDPMASAGAVDSQTVPGASTVGRNSRGWDAGKKTNGRKRHLVVDTMGLLVVVLVTAASVQELAVIVELAQPHAQALVYVSLLHRVQALARPERLDLRVALEDFEP